VENIMRFL
jgi:hypothetical protein